MSQTSGGDSGEEDSGSPSVSTTGRYVAFNSSADNFPGADGTTDVLIHDFKTGKTKLVSKTSAGDPATGADSFTPSISPSGRHVGFGSLADNLPGAGSFRQIYLHDRDAGKTKLVSKNSQGEPAVGGDSVDASVSASGRFVAFESSATNLVPEDGLGVPSIYVRDLKKGKTRLVSKTSAGDPAFGDSEGASISASGRYVAFASTADNLPGDDSVINVYVHDRRIGKTRLVSRTSAGVPADDGSIGASISASGRYVAFQSAADNLPGDDSVSDVYVHDRRTGKTRLVSKTSAGESANEGSQAPSISASGRRVAFDSGATNLPGDDAFFDVFVRDLDTGKTILASRTSSGDPISGGEAVNNAIAPGGRFVAFESDAPNLPGITPYDVYRRGPLG